MKTERIDREDMLELTRRMTVKRNCFGRIAGGYIDEEGYVEGTFNQHFLKLTPSEREKNLQIAKAIPFSETNVQLKQYRFGKQSDRASKIQKMLLELNSCGLKNDAFLEVFYELVAETYEAKERYGIYVFHGTYDIPLKGMDKASQWESEEVYPFLVCAICPVSGDYVAGEPDCGFLYPAFCNRSGDAGKINVFQKDADNPHMELLIDILGI